MLFLLLLAFLVPVTVYCLFLGSLNRRSRPVMIPGHWDCIALLLALSGFFFVVVPGILVTIHDKSLRDASLAVDEQASTVQDTLFRLWFQWWWIFLAYYTMLLCVAGLLLWWRKGKTIVYNLEPGALETVLAHVAAALGLDVTRSHEYLILEKRGHIPQMHGEPVVVVDTFPLLCNVTLHWPAAAAGGSRDQIERELRKQLKHVTTPDNPAGGWLLGIGGFLMGLIFLIGALLVAANYFPRRW